MKVRPCLGVGSLRPAPFRASSPRRPCRRGLARLICATATGRSVKSLHLVIGDAVSRHPPAPCSGRCRRFAWRAEIASIVGPWRSQSAHGARSNPEDGRIWSGTSLNETGKKALQEPVRQEKTRYFKAPVFAVAPMIDWTDRPGK